MNSALRRGMLRTLQSSRRLVAPAAAGRVVLGIGANLAGLRLLSTSAIPAQEPSPAPKSHQFMEMGPEILTSSQPADLDESQEDTGDGVFQSQEPAGTAVPNPYAMLSAEDLTGAYASNQNYSRDSLDEFLFAFRYKRMPEQALKVLEDMKMYGLQPGAKSYANAILSGCYLFFASELEDLVNSGMAIFNPQDKKYDIKKRIAQCYMEAVNDQKIEFQGELYAPMILRCVGRGLRKEFSSTAFVFAKQCATKGYAVQGSVYSLVMAALNRNDLDGQVVSLYESMPEGSINFFIQLHYLRSLIKLDRATDAFNLLDRFIEDKPNVLQIFNVLINAALKKNNLLVAKSLYNKLLSIGLEPDEMTIGLFVDMGGRMKETNAGLIDEFNEEARKHAVQLGSKYYNAMVRAYVKIDINKVAEILKEAVTKQHVDRYVLESVISLMADNKVPSFLKLEFYAMLAPMLAGKRPTDTFVASMYALIDSRVLELFSAIEEAVTAAGGRLHSEAAYRAVMRCFQVRKQTDAMLALIEHVISNNVQFTSCPIYMFNAALEAAVARGEWPQAADIERNMRYRGIPMKPYVREKYDVLRKDNHRRATPLADAPQPEY